MAFDPNNPTASGLVLTFDDEFTTSSISSDSVANATKWNDHIWFHAPAPGDFSVANGVMNILGNPSDPWAANMMTTNSAGQGFTQKYGYYEADIKVPAGQGTWPSFWGFSLNSILGQPVPASEFDILEGQGSAPTYYWSTVHQATNNSGGMSDATNGNATINSGMTLSDAFHRFGMLWDPNSSYITFYLDGKPTIQVPKWSTTDSSAISLILGSGIGDMIGTNQPGPTTPNPADMQVDYARVYQFASQNPTAVQAGQISTASGNTDAVALVNALGQGNVATPPPSGSGTGTGSGSGSNSTSVTVSGDMYNGNPQIAVLIDGHQIGTYTVTAHHSLGQTQTITLPGSFDPGAAHTVQVQFLNDGWDGIPNADGHDRNVYIEGVTVNGVTDQGQAFVSNNASLGYGSLDPKAAVMLINGDVTYNVAAPPPVAQVPTLSIQPASGTQGSAIPLTITAAQASTSLAIADLTVAVSGLGGATLNHGTHNADGSYTLHAADLQGLSLSPPSGFTGALSLQVTATDTEASSSASTPAQTLGVSVNPSAVTAPSGSGGQLSLVVSGDMYNGDPQIAVLVDGQQVGTYDVSAHHSQGQVQTIDVAGSFDPSLAHQVQVQFLNDGWDQIPNLDGHDRNVYVESVTLNGTTVQGQNFASNNASLGEDSLDPHAAVMLTNGVASYGVSSAEPVIAPSYASGAQEVYVFSSMAQAGGQITSFNPAEDILDLTQVLKSAGYSGTNPIGDHVVNLAANAYGGTAVTIDPTGHDPSHATTLVTLDHVLPQTVPAADIWHA